MHNVGSSIFSTHENKYKYMHFWLSKDKVYGQFHVEPTTTLRTLETLYFGRRCSIATVYCLHMNTMYILDSNGALSLSLSLFFPSSHCMHIHIQMRAMEEWDVFYKC